jgi:hypothetical protein
MERSIAPLNLDIKIILLLVQDKAIKINGILRRLSPEFCVKRKRFDLLRV